jgi:hypothetical protein
MLDHRRVTRAPGWSPQPPAGFRPPGRNLPPRRPGGLLIGVPCLPLARLRWGFVVCVFWGPSPRPPAGGASPPGPPVVGVGFWGVWGVCWLALQPFSPSALHPSLLITFTPHPSPPSLLTPSPSDLHALRPSGFCPSPSSPAPRPFILSAPFGRTRSPAPRPSCLTPSPFDPSRPFDLLPSVLRHLRWPFAVLRPFTFRRSSAAPLRPHLALRVFAPHPFALRRIRPLTFTPFDPSRPSAFCLPSFDTFAALCPFAFRRSLAASLRLRLALRVFAPHTFALQASHPSPLRGLGLGLG